jgi:hypothetical protein
MRNVFILYMPTGNREAMVHYEDTIRKKVALDRIVEHVPSIVATKLRRVFGMQLVPVWGSQDSRANRAKFERMNEGDEILIVEGKTIKLLGRIVAKAVSPALSRRLWQNLRGGQSTGWDLIYFIANPLEIDLPFKSFCALVGYESEYQLRGLTSVSSERLKQFYSKYDDLYSVLMKIKDGSRIEELKEATLLYAAQSPSDRAIPQEKAPLREPEVSDHLRMQWLLLKMGKQAGQRVWAPRGDQSRIVSEFHFQDFEETFAAGLNTQVRYLENIDVVWKEQFRIDAAFEIENSTSVYSGLLRFADLTMVAPNTIYPMFIVAPSERRNRIAEQLARPTFKHLRLSEKVRYLSYEKVNEVNDFFGDEGTGLSAAVLHGKAEQLS